MSSLKLKVLTITRQNTSQDLNDEDDVRSTPTSPISAIGQKKRDEFFNRGRRASYVQSKGALRVVCTEEPVANGKVEISFDWGNKTSTPSPLSSPILDARKPRRRGSIITTPSPLPSSLCNAPFSPAFTSDSTPLKFALTPPEFTSTPPHASTISAFPANVRRRDIGQEGVDANLLDPDLVKSLDFPSTKELSDGIYGNGEGKEEEKFGRRLSRLESIVAKDCELINVGEDARSLGSSSKADLVFSGEDEKSDEGMVEEEEEITEETETETEAPLDRGSSSVCEERDYLESIVAFICSEDVMKIAIPLEEEKRKREEDASSEGGTDTEAKYLVIAGPQDLNENVILGITCKNETISLGIILKIYAESEITLHPDGGVIFNSLVNQSGQGSTTPHYFKPVSVFSTWTLMHYMNYVITKARERNVHKANSNYSWTKFYKDKLTSDTLALKDWNTMPDIDSQARASVDKRFSNASTVDHNIKIGLRDIMTSGEVDLEDISTIQLRKLLEARLKTDLKGYRRLIDAEMLNILGQLDSPSKILDCLYLGSEWNASNLEELTGNEVTNILNVAREIDNFFPGLLNYYNVREDDVESADMMKYWHETSKFIAQVEASGGRVLVHCKMGVSRSASTVIAFLMKSRSWSAEKAFAFVKERRPVIRPNKGFLRQLETFEGILNASSNRRSFKMKKTVVVDEGGDGGADEESEHDDDGHDNVDDGVGEGDD